ncbi:MAG: sugar-transfer associated ATP-grasp domain-containing protein [Anaerolineae bacterium]
MMWRPSNLLYIAYYVLKTDYRELLAGMRWIHRHTGIPYLALAGDILGSSCKYAISFKDYFTFRFYHQSRAARSNFAGAGTMYRFCTQMNARRHRRIFRSKALFLQHFNQLMGRQSLYLSDSSLQVFTTWISQHPLIVAKPNYGTQGHGFEFIDTADRQPSDLYACLLRKGQDIIEEPIVQHPALQKLYPSSVNTIRVLTICSGSQVEIIGTDLKLGTGGMQVDNMSSGGISAPIDTDTGIISGPAASPFVWDPPYQVHPDTREPIPGFQVPHWDSVLELAIRAARVVPTVRSVGWDIAVTSTGAILVEGNDNWGGPFRQLYDDCGFKDVLQRYADV